MMFYVIIHMPVQELNWRGQIHSAAAQTKVRHVVFQSHMLGTVAESMQCIAIKRTKRNE